MRSLGRKFALVWTAATVSALGDGLMTVGLPLLARQVTDKPLVIATVFAAGRVPWLFSIVIGAIVDRRDARQVLVTMDLLRALVLGALGIALIVRDKLPSVSVICALAAFLALCAIAFFAAIQRVVPSLVDNEALEDANGYLQSGVNTGEQFIGPALGAYFAAGGKVPVIGDAISFAASGLVLSRLPAIPAVNMPEMRVRQDVAIGWAWFRRSPTMRWLTATSALFVGLQGSVIATEVVLVRDTLSLDGYWFGVFTALVAVGAISGGIVASKVIAVLRSSTILVAISLSGLTYLVCIGSRSPLVVFTAIMVQNFTIGVNNVSTVSVRQRAVPPELRGRVISLARSFVWGLQVPGALFGGWIAGRYGTDMVFEIAGAGMLCISVLAARPLRSLLAPYQAPQRTSIQPVTAQPSPTR